MTVAQSVVQTTIAGAYTAKTVNGTAVRTPLAQLKASLGLTASQKPYIMIFDTDAKKSHLAMDCVNAAADALNAKLVATLNVELGAKENNKWVTLSSGSAALVVGLPKDADLTKTHFVVCVQPGGVLTILEDQDTEASTVTFEVQAGIGTYAIIEQ